MCALLSSVPDGPAPEWAADVFAARRARLLERLPEGAALVLPGGVIRHSSRDSEYPFRPDSELYWCTGVREPGALAVIRRDGDQLTWTLFARDRDPEAELWSGVREGPEAMGERLGADAAWPLSAFATELPALLADARTIHFRMGAHERVESLVVEALQRGRARGARRGDGPRSLVDPGEALDDLRLVKDAHEIERMRHAAALTLRGFEAGIGAVRDGAGEWQVQAALEAEFRRGSGEPPAFGTIVGAGARGCVLHYVENQGRMRRGDLVLIDAGASYGLYAGDVTRTVPVGGAAAVRAEARAVHEAVDAARRTVVALARPGITVQELHDAAVRTLTDFLVSEGLIRGDHVQTGCAGDGAARDAGMADGSQATNVAAEGDESAPAEPHKPFFPHSTSHWLGLDVHDPGDYARQDHSRVLEPGMVLTVEPGLYFGPAALSAGGAAAERFEGIAVRLEDDLLITAEGCENLTAQLPTELDAFDGPGPG